MNENKIQNILSLSVQERYEYLIRKVADFEEIWLSKNDKSEIQTLLIEDKIESIPIWPEKGFTELTFKGKRANLVAESMDLYEFTEWLSVLHKEGYKLAVFPLSDLKSILSEPLKLKEHIEIECKQYE